MRKVLTLLLVVIVPFQCFAAGYPTHVSKIPGVQLWDMRINESGFPEEVFDEDPSNEFIKYCDGKRTVYINSNPSAYTCKSDGNNRIIINKRDKGLVGLAIVSMRPLPAPSKPLPLTKAESAALAQIETRLKVSYAKEAMEAYKEQDPSVDDASYEKMINEIRSEPAFMKRRMVRYKIAVNNKFIFISPIAIYPNAIGWDLKYGVFSEQKGVLQHVGDIQGCICNPPVKSSHA